MAEFVDVCDSYEDSEFGVVVDLEEVVMVDYYFDASTQDRRAVIYFKSGRTAKVEQNIAVELTKILAGRASKTI